MRVATQRANRPELYIRLVLHGSVLVGPEHAKLLEAIREHRSISVAGREVGTSYKHTWNVVRTMNLTLGAPVVETVKGGYGGGGAQLTEAGELVLSTYRRLEANAMKATTQEVEVLIKLLDASR